MKQSLFSKDQLIAELILLNRSMSETDTNDTNVINVTNNSKVQCYTPFPTAPGNVTHFNSKFKRQWLFRQVHVGLHCDKKRITFHTINYKCFNA